MPALYQPQVDAFLIALEAAAPDPMAIIEGPEIAALFGRTPSWMRRPAVRRALYADGFPLPLSRGRWNRRAVCAYILARSGMAPEPALRPVSVTAPPRIAPLRITR